MDRATLAFLCEAYTEDQAPDENGVPQPRVVMRFHPRLAPVKLAVFPLVKKDSMPEVADRIYVLEHGRVALEGPAATLARDPTVQKTYLGVA